MGGQGMHQGRALNDDANSRMAMTVNPPLVALRQPKPTLQIEIVPDLFPFVLADEKAGKEAEHHRGHLGANRILGRLELIDKLLELLLAIRTILASGLEGCRHLR